MTAFEAFLWCSSAATIEPRSVKEGMSARELSAGETSSRPKRVRTKHFEVAVVGGGQAGLAMGYYLRRAGASVRHPRAGRFDRAGLARALGLADALHAAPLQRAAGPALPGRPGRLPDARRGDRLPGALRGDLRAPDRAQQRGAQAFPRGRALRSRGRRPDDHRRPGRRRDRAHSRRRTCPSSPTSLDPSVWQAHSTGYRRPSDVPEGTVLVVGGGNTGFQIAKELSATHKVVLSVGSKQKPLPQRIAGRDLFWWLTKTRSDPQDRRIAPRATAASTGTR